jgi:predicted dehydrogenase
MRTVRAAVIGTGFMGEAHAEALRRVPGVEVAAVASHRKARAEALAAKYGVAHALDDWRRVLDLDDVEVVHNCTPNHLHFEVNRALLEAGRHVVAEKPLTVDVAEAEALVQLAEERGVVNAVNFNYRFYPLVQHARALVQAGEVGDVHLVHGHYVQDWLLHETDYNWRVDREAGGASRAFADIGSHWCDLVQFVTGRRITRVFADLFTFHETRQRPTEAAETFRSGQGAAEAVPVETEDGANVLLQFEGGARGAVVISQVSAGRKNREWFEVDGSRCALAWDQEQPNELWLGRRDGPNETLVKDPGLLAERARAYAHYPGGHPEGYPDGFKNHLLAVYRAVRDGLTEPPDFPTFADGLRAVRLVEAVLTSHREGRWVEVDGPRTTDH